MEQILNLVKAVREYDYSYIVVVWKTLAFVVSLVFAVGIIYAARRAHTISREWMGRVFGSAGEKKDEFGGKLALVKAREDWEKILEQGASEEESQRKIALIAADSLLDKILRMSGYEGENLGERLKQIEPSDLSSLDALWDAHKTRNRIAHEANYALSKEDALSALTNYGKALRELKYL